MLKAIKKLFSKPSPAYGLNSEELYLIKQSKESIFYDLLQQVASALQEEAAEALIGTTDNAMVHYQRGYITGIRALFLTIERLTEENERRTDDRSAINREREILATFGTDYWRAINGLQ